MLLNECNQVELGELVRCSQWNSLDGIEIEKASFILLSDSLLYFLMCVLIHVRVCVQMQYRELKVDSGPSPNKRKRTS